MYKYGCLYVYQRFIMLDKGMKSILKFWQRYMEVAILIASQSQVLKYENGVAYLLSYTVSVEKMWTQNTRIIHDV
jgi:hypothetical protein